MSLPLDDSVYVGGHPSTTPPPTADGGDKAADDDSISISFFHSGEETLFTMVGILADDTSLDGLYGSTIDPPTSPVARLPSHNTTMMQANDSEDEAGRTIHVEGVNLKSTGLDDASSSSSSSRHAQSPPKNEGPHPKENDEVRST
jgi:hypothetical protein